MPISPSTNADLPNYVERRLSRLMCRNSDMQDLSFWIWMELQLSQILSGMFFLQMSETAAPVPDLKLEVEKSLILVLSGVLKNCLSDTLCDSAEDWHFNGTLISSHFAFIYYFFRSPK